MLPEQVHLLRIYIGEKDRHEGKLLYEHIVARAMQAGLAGAAVFRGVCGFGAHSSIHSAKILDLSADLPIVIEIVDEQEKIESFLPLLDELIPEGMVTVDKLHMRKYRKK